MRQSVCQSMERPKMNKKSQRSAPMQRSGSQFNNPENPSNTRLYPCRRPPFRAELMNNITFLVLPWSHVKVSCAETRKVILFISSARNGSILHGYKWVFDRFSGFKNWLSERSTASLLWDFLFILGGS